MATPVAESIELLSIKNVTIQTSVCASSLNVLMESWGGWWIVITVVEILFIYKFMNPELDLSNHSVKVILTESWVYNNRVFSQGNYFQSSSEYVQAVYRNCF